MKRISAVRTVTNATEDITGTVIERDSDATENKLPTLSKHTVKPSSNTRGEMEQVLAGLAAMMKPMLRR